MDTKLYLNADLRGQDFSDVDISDSTFIDCDMIDIVLPNDLKLMRNVNFINCKFGVLVDGNIYLTPFYLANYRIKDLCFANFKMCSEQEIYASFSSKIIEQMIDPEKLANHIYYIDGDDYPHKCYYGYKLLIVKISEFNGIYAIAKLRIDKDTRAILYKDCKCRVEKATVMYIKDFNGVDYTAASSCVRDDIVYEVGKEIVSDDWDDDPMHECTHGIHFFLTPTEAWRYCI